MPGPGMGVVSVIVLAGFLAFGGHSSSANAEVHYFDFVVKSTNFTRVCTTKSMLTVNDSFPGLTLTVRRGDTAYVNVYNHAPYGITIHWSWFLGSMVSNSLGIHGPTDSCAGVWFLHCHFDRHMMRGMDMAFIVKDGGTATTSMKKPPAYMPPCGPDTNFTLLSALHSFLHVDMANNFRPGLRTETQ